MSWEHQSLKGPKISLEVWPVEGNPLTRFLRKKIVLLEETCSSTTLVDGGYW